MENNNEKCELYINNREEMLRERKRLWKEGWVVYEENYYDSTGHIKVWVFKAIRI